MALVTIVIEDDADGATVTVFAEPEIPIHQDDRSVAQAMAAEMLAAVSPTPDTVPA